MPYFKKYKILPAHQKGLVFFGICVLLFLSLRNGAAPKPFDLSNTTPTPDIVTMHAQPLARKLHAVGQIKSEKPILLIPEMYATVSEIKAPEGSTVQKNDPIVIFQNKGQKEALESAESRLKQRQLEFEAAKKLTAKGFKSETGERQAQADLEKAEADVAMARAEVEKLTLRAPFDHCYVNQLDVNVGQNVGPLGQGMGHIIDLSKMEGHFHVSESDIHQLKLDMPITIHVEGRTNPLHGIIHHMAKVANPKTRTFLVVVRIETQTPPFTLHDGQTARGSFSIACDRGYHIPFSAVNLNENGVPGIKIIENGHVKFAPVPTKNIEKDHVIVTDLPNTIHLIRYGGDFIANGEPVEFDVEHQSHKGARDIKSPKDTTETVIGELAASKNSEKDKKVAPDQSREPKANSSKPETKLDQSPPNLGETNHKTPGEKAPHEVEPHDTGAQK